ncbi:3-keto-disaccharide hydrolase [Cerasicoccus maritimus]|uniref:3-keto-disaccharide hydrolase n=1 Tax=Cerasicoccus maritimus TaxID=490089 RepID=UPI0028525CCF|nr:DUF1080 domain-containing protein [Cerasicoccus maritimus]
MFSCAASADTQTLPQGPLVELSFYDGEKQLDSGHAWTIEAGELVCSGKPRGYLILAENVSDYTLTLEWKWDSETGGNSGVLLHALPATSGFRTWPSSIEVQLQHGMAGDIYAIGQLPGFVGEGSMFVAPGVPVTRLDRKETADKPVGEWNTLEVIAQGAEMTVIVNGQTVNQISKVEPSKGAIALQSEGAPVRFRNIQLKQ